MITHDLRTLYAEPHVNAVVVPIPSTDRLARAARSAGPAHQLETILYADVRPEELVGPRWQLDIAGHCVRPDEFEPRVHRLPKPIVRTVMPQVANDEKDSCR